MNRKQKITTGTFLCVVGFFFYCQTALDAGYVNATRNDFAHLYLAGYLAERGGNFFGNLLLYVHTHLKIPTGLNPFVYPPFFALLLIPLSRFSYDMAWFFFTLLSHASYFASLAILTRILRKDEEEPIVFWWGILMALSACFYPLMKTYSAGQMNTFMLLAIVSGAYLLSRKNDYGAGFVFGFSAAIKVTPLFLLLFCCWTKRWQAAITGFITVFLSVVISLAVLGTEVHAGFLSMAKDMGYGSSTWSQYKQTYHVDPFNQAPSALWYRLLSNTQTEQFGTIEGIANAPNIAKVFSYLTSIFVIVLLAFVTPRRSNRFSLAIYSLWTIGMLLVPSLLWDHYLVQALFAIAIALRLSFEGTAREAFGLGTAIAILAIPFFHHSPLFRDGWMTLFMSIKLAGLVLLMGYLIGYRGKETERIPETVD